LFTTIFERTVDILGIKLVVVILELIERGVVKLETNALFGPSVEVVVDGINMVIGFVVEFVMDTDANVDVMFKDLTLLAVVTSSIFIVSLCP